MTDKTTVSSSTRIASSPETVFKLVTDLPRMGEWSPEATGGEWVGGDGPAVGVKFKGTNAHGDKKWSALAKVTEVTPSRRFAFANMMGPITISEWSYEISPVDGGAACDLTESWNLKQKVLIGLFSRFLTGVEDRTAHTRSMIETTLAAIKATAEGVR